MEKEKVKLYAENSKVAMYMSRLGDECEIEIQPRQKNKPQIFMITRKPEFPLRGVDDTIDYLVSLEDPWETLPELNPDIGMKRQELKDYPFKDTDPRKGKAPNDSWLGGWVEFFSHVQPIPYLTKREDVSNNTNRIHIPSISPDKYVLILNHTKSFGRPIFEYGALESFCERKLGPSIRRTGLSGDSFKEIMKCSNEDEANRILRGLEEFPGDTNTARWNCLDILYPNFQERVERLQEFQENWFPGEIIRARKSYEDSREWLKSLKN